MSCNVGDSSDVVLSPQVITQYTARPPNQVASLAVFAFGIGPHEFRFSSIESAIVRIKFHHASSEKRAVPADAAPVMGIHAGLSRRENSRACSGSDCILVPFYCCSQTDRIRCEVRQNRLDKVKYVDYGVVCALASVCLDISRMFPTERARDLHIDMGWKASPTRATFPTSCTCLGGNQS